MNRSQQRRRVLVWDLPVRLFHWVLVATVAALWASGEFGQLSLHMNLGVGVLALVLFRLGWGIAGSRTARFSQFIKGPRGIADYLRHPDPAHIGHNPLGALSVVGLLALVGVQAVSGLFTSDDIFTEGPLAHLASSGTVSLLSTIHRIGFKVLLALVALHVAAIVFYKLVKKDDLVRPMISGWKDAPVSAEPNAGGSLAVAVAMAAGAAALAWGGVTLLAG